MTVELVTATWAASIPAEWTDFAVLFSNDQESGYVNFAGSKLMALKGSMLRGTHPHVVTLFAGMIKGGLAIEVAAEEKK